MSKLLSTAMPRLACGLVAILLVDVSVCVAEAPKPGGKIEREESWQVILMGNERIGYSRALVEPFEQDGEQLVRSVAEMHMAIKRFGQTLRMGTMLLTEETLDGSVRKFTFETTNPPKAPVRTVGRVEGKKLLLETE